MEHSFIESKLDSTKCARCRKAFLYHTPFAECESCSNVGELEFYPRNDFENGLLLCSACFARESDHQSPEKQQARLDAVQHSASEVTPNGVLNISSLQDKARTLDYSIGVRQDIHNAETISTYAVFQEIESNPDINNKQFAKAKFLDERYAQYSEAIFAMEEKTFELRSKLRVMQQEMNKLANTLRAEERTKLTTQSPDYKPGKVKSARESKPRAIAAKKAKFDKVELIKQTQLLQAEGFPIQLNNLQTICVQRDMTPLQAAGVVRKMMGPASQ